ncbi:putative zinc finger CCHC domain-containing protein [Acorus calamus]|uniref:Zinc finger CCHC domain-containing protein n=1 Tax=Acorus calamus TaxID=4465 RepID=A0AAV9C6V0_ACOCL|nr:putative zinc finger CCHC domain-containing protein [Acorus calamus]
MEGDDEGPRLSKRFSDKAVVGPNGEVDYKTKAGTAWSHSYLNQKPWHPLSYPNQRRKWIAEQTDAERCRRADEIAREFSQEQEFLRQTSLVSQKEKEKLETIRAVSFMYVRPPGYNAESAKAAEIADQARRDGGTDQGPSVASSSTTPKDHHGEDKKKARPKDVFGRALPTEEEFEVLKNAPRLETGLPGRVKPFGVEIRNVRCVRCGKFGHQSGDRECPLKDAIMPNEESRLKRDDPLTAIMSQMDPTEPLKWELKQMPGMSPPRGGFTPDDPNQQIVAEDIFDEYGGFLCGGGIPDLLTNLSVKKIKKHSKKKRKSKHRSSDSGNHLKSLHKNKSPSSSDCESDRKRKRSSKSNHRSSRTGDLSKSCHKNKSPSSSDCESERERKRRSKSNHRSCGTGNFSKSRHKIKSPSSSECESDRERKRRSKNNHRSSGTGDLSKSRLKNRSPSSSDSESDGERKRISKSKHKRERYLHSDSSDSENSGSRRHRGRNKHGHHK